MRSDKAVRGSPGPSRRQPRTTALALALLGALPGAAYALDVRYEIGASLLRSDNIALSESNEVDETVLSPQLRFEAEQAGSAIQMAFKGEMEYLHYVDDTFDDEVRGELSGHLNWTVIPDRMDVVFKDYLSRQPINVLTSFNPSNQQQVNVFIAGPSFYARLGDSTRGQLDLRYTNSYAEETREFNGDRFNVATRVLHELSTTATVSANVEATRVKYDVASSVSDYSRYEAYVGYTRDLNSIDFGVDAGYTRLERNGAGSGSNASPMARANVIWRATSRSEFSGNLSYQFADAAQDVAARADPQQSPLINDLTTSDVLVGPGVYRQRRLELGYRYTGERMTFQVRPYYQRQHYLDLVLPDQTYRGGIVALDYRLRPRLTLSLAAARERRKFDDLSRDDTDSNAYVSLADQLTRHWSWRLDLQHRERDSSEAGQSYDENAVVFTFAYRR